MGFLNRKKKTDRLAGAHLNWMGGPSFDVSDPLLRLRMAASSCFFGEPMYYHRDRGDTRKVRHAPRSRLSDAQVAHLRTTLGALDPAAWRGLSPAKLMERAIDDALAADPEATLREAIRLRSEAQIRVTPQVILVRAANHPAVRGTGLVRRCARQIILRADEPATGLAYQLSAFGREGIPNSLKKAWRDALERFDDYQLAKYRLEGRAVKTVDVVNLVRPRSESVDRLVRGALKVSDRTWEGVLSTRGSSRESWLAALPKMGHMALLRNLRNLLHAGVEPGLFADRLVAGVAGGRQLPFRYYSAWRAVSKAGGDPVVARALEACLSQSVENLPWFGGRVMSLCDNSGSAQGTATSAMGSMKVSTIANLSAALAAQRADQGWIGVFGDRLQTRRVHRGVSVLAEVDRAEEDARDIGMGTENGIWLFWDEAIRRNQLWDHVFVFSDMQAGHGGLYGVNKKEYADYVWPGGGRYIDVPKLIAAYRRRVNPKVKVYLVQVAGYQDTIVPEFYDGTFILGGWGPGLFRFAAEMAGR